VAGLIVVLLAGCRHQPWPPPPAVDPSEYRSNYELWRIKREVTADQAARMIGVWALPEGETPFGSDASLPVVLPAAASPFRAGVFRREAEKITIIPAAGVSLHWQDGRPITRPSEVDDVLALGSLRLHVEEVGEGFSGRRFVTAWDEGNSAARRPTEIQTYPIDLRWRVAARFDAFDERKPIAVADVRGGVQHLVAAGRLVFRMEDKEWRLTAITVPSGDEFLVMFRDRTNETTTYSGYRIVLVPGVADREWTVLDFNLAANPPCGYSNFTLCPLPPPENVLGVAIEAGERRWPGALSADAAR
jgi:uncharacterized protein